jgi:copper transport protein
MSRLRRIGALLTIVAALVVWSPQTASAHAFLTSSSPGDGSVLTSPPTQLRLDFSETVVLAATQLDIVAENGRHYAVSNLRIEGEGGEEPSQVLAALPNLPRGAYRVSWQTLSADDLHRTAGVLVFGVGHAVTAAGLDEPKPAAGEAALRWITFLALSLALGGALMRRLVRRQGGAAAPAWAGLTRGGEMLGAYLGAAAAFALLAYQIVEAGSSGLLSGSYGVRWGLREVGFLLLVGCAFLRPSRIRASGVGLGAGLVAIGTALLGHSGAGPSLSLTRVLADALHLVSAATWAGALVYGLLIVLGRDHRPAALAVLRSFGLPAAACISVVIVTGLYLTSGVIGSVDAALVTFYGRALLLKVGLVAVVGGLGLLNHFRLRRRSGPLLSHRTLIGEAALGLVVLGLAALITSGQPALEPQLVKDAAAQVVPIQDARVVDLQQALAVRPNRPGQNHVLVDVFDTRRPAPAPIRQVTVSLVDADGTDSGPVPAAQLADGRWSAPVALKGTGLSRITVTVQRPGLPDAVHAYHWAVGGAPAADRSVLVSTRPIRKELLMIWFVVMFLVTVAWWVAMVTRLRKVAARRTAPAAEVTAAEIRPPRSRDSADVAG